MLLSTGVLALSAIAASATDLWIADYGGDVTTVSLTESGGQYNLTNASRTDACGPNPSWLTVDTNRGLLFCLNEGLTSPNGSVASFTINADNSLNAVKNETVPIGPVSGLIYGNAAGQRGLVAAHYVGSAVTTYKLLGEGRFERGQEFFYTGKGPEEQQDAPHPHEVIMDPTGQYILVPDLGLDKVHVFSWDHDTLALKELDPLNVNKGTGPRHAVFWNPYGTACESCTTFMYLVGELAADVTSFAVSYEADGAGLSFKNVSSQLTQADNPRNAPAEVEITPDGRFMIVSNRDVVQPPEDSTRSSLATFCLHDDGSLNQPMLTKSTLLGTGYPRHFSMNAYGNLVAVGLQNTNKAIVLARNTSSGEILSEAVAQISLNGNVTNVMWAD